MENNIVGISEIAEMAKVTSQVISNWRRRYDDFPKPAQNLQSGPVWNREVVEMWLKQKEGRTPHVISFINLKGGVAKTTTAVGTAEILAQEHRKSVLVIDLDPQTNATINLISEEKWMEMDNTGRTLAQLFQDRVSFEQEPKFKIEDAIVRQVSTINGGIAKLELLPSSIKLVNLQDKIAAVSFADDYRDPRDILKIALEPVIDRYDYVIIDCPPSLGVVTKNGLRISTGYIIPTIPDILSTWGVFQIVDSVHRFSGEMRRPIHPLGIVATKVQKTALHDRVQADLRAGRLFEGKPTDIKQPPLFNTPIGQRTATAEGADFASNPRTFRQKYGPDNYESLKTLTQEIIDRCNALKP